MIYTIYMLFGPALFVKLFVIRKCQELMNRIQILMWTQEMFSRIS